MPVRFYMDVHVPVAIADQLRRHQVDVLTAIDDGRRRAPDDKLLEHARQLGRVVFTHDIRFKAMAEQWQREGRPFAGLVFCHPQKCTIGQCVHDLLLIAKASDEQEWLNKVEYLPL